MGEGSRVEEPLVDQLSLSCLLSSSLFSLYSLFCNILQLTPTCSMSEVSPLCLSGSPTRHSLSVPELTSLASFPPQQEVEAFFIDVEALQETGISAQDIAKLRSAGFATVTGVIQVRRAALSPSSLSLSSLPLSRA